MEVNMVFGDTQTSAGQENAANGDDTYLLLFATITSVLGTRSRMPAYP